MIRSVALDDEPPALKVLENFCSRVGYISLEKVFTSPAEALKYMKKFPVDLLFLDIQMKGTTGIEISRQLPQNIKIIFTTGHSQYAVESYELQAVDYLLKPFSFDRFLKAIARVDELLKPAISLPDSEQAHLFIRADYSLVKVYFKDILFIEGLDDYLKIHLEGQKTVVARMTLKNILEKLPDSEFVRVHRSFIVPLSKIEVIKGRLIQVAGEEIPVGASFETNLMNRFRPIS